MSLKINRYPVIGIRSKNELAKRISDKSFTQKDALTLINDVLKNFDSYWRDVKSASDTEKNKYVRSAKKTPLGKLLSLINKKVLAPYDNLVPGFFFGGISDRNHIKAVQYLLGKKRKRSKLGLDISRFFEQNTRDRVFNLFYGKCKCSKKGAKLLTDLCCVPFGPKNSGCDNKVLARGFATSTRLALWCNLDLFLRIFWQTSKSLKNKDPKIAFFVDDIGITASGIEDREMDILTGKISDILKKDKNHQLSLNTSKTNIENYKDKSMEHLGIKIGKRKLSVGKKTKAKINIVNKKLSSPKITKEERKILLKKKKSYRLYKNYIKKINN